MECPYQDIGCWYIDDVTHECEARQKSECRHEDAYYPEEARDE